MDGERAERPARGSRREGDELEHRHVVIATGAHWTRMLYTPMEVPGLELNSPGVFTPEDVAAGLALRGPIVVFDFDNYYMGSALAEHLAAYAVGAVSYVTPAGHASAWTIMTNEQPQVHRALARAGVSLHTLSHVGAFDGETVTLRNLFTGAEVAIACRSLVIVGLRKPNDALYHALATRQADLSIAGIASVSRIGDALAPGAIVHAVHSGHTLARSLDAAPGTEIYRRDVPITLEKPRMYAREHGIPQRGEQPVST
jgi:dimethylamine/trimethylamine dehydrogenase